MEALPFLRPTRVFPVMSSLFQLVARRQEKGVFVFFPPPALLFMLFNMPVKELITIQPQSSRSLNWNQYGRGGGGPNAITAEDHSHLETPRRAAPPHGPPTRQGCWRAHGDLPAAICFT